jgi:hypothetical protein
MLTRRLDFAGAPALRAAIACAVAACAVLSLGPRPRAQAQMPVVDLTAEGVVAAASKYVEEYQRAFSFLVADEEYVQRLAEDKVPKATRWIRGELFMTYLPVDGEWITVHDAIEVDGRPVANREDLRRLLQTGDAGSIVERVANHNAQFNIGTVTRNFNEPTLPLLILEARRVGNSRFRRQLVAEDGPATIVTVSFEERDRPTLIGSASGGPVFAKGSFDIEAGTGRVRRSRFELEDDRVKGTLDTTYAHEPRLDLWVPTVFREVYELRHRSGKQEVVIAESAYRNYRRFEATGRIKR